MQKAVTLLSIIILSFAKLTAQEQKKYSFVHYDIQNGLAAYNAPTITQDSAGYMWIGTLNGLQRFDGNHWITFHNDPSNNSSIPDNGIVQILYDKKKRLWLMLKDGSIGTFNTHTFRFNKAAVITTKPNILQNLRKMVQDSEGNIFYIFINQEILMYNEAGNEFAARHAPFSIPQNFKPVGITQDGFSKKYFIGTDSGLVVFNEKTKIYSYRNHNDGQEAIIKDLGNLVATTPYEVDSRGRLWFLWWPTTIGYCTLYCYDLQNNKTVLSDYNLPTVVGQYIEPDFFLEQKDGTIWITGLYTFLKYHEDTKTFEVIFRSFKNTESIYYETAFAFEDREKNMWIGTSNNGIYMFNPGYRLFTSYKHINRKSNQPGNGYLLSFAFINNNLLTGVWGDGLYRYDDKFNMLPLNMSFIKEVNGTSVWDILPLKDKETVWIVGQYCFIFVYKPATNSAVKYSPVIFEGRTLRQAKEDRSGNIWIGCQGRGLFKWSPGKAAKNFEDGFYKIKSVPNVSVRKIIVDNEGYIWVTTGSEGVYKIDPLTDLVVEHLTKSNGPHKSLLANDATAIYQYNDSLMVIATGGLNIYNKQSHSMRHITSNDGLPADAVVSIEKDRSGYLWLGLTNGICRMSLTNNNFLFFDRNDGIANDNFQVVASYVLPDGKMLFGSSDDFVVFDPDNVKNSQRPPNVTITGFKLLDKSLLIDSLLQLNKVELATDQNSVTISFAAISYVNKTRFTYYYQLEGIDKIWRKADVLNEAIYNYLPPGKYIFRVKVENADGVSNSNITELVIRIKAPFWKTWWFVSLLVLGGIAILYWTDKFRVGRIRETERVRTRIATSLTKDMSSTLSNINMLSEMAKLKVDKDIPRTKDYISQISNNSNRMMEVMDDMIWSIDPENDELQHTIVRMKRYAASIQSKYNIEVNFVTDTKVRYLKLHMDKRHEFFLIFKEALLNAGLHSNGRFVEVHISSEGSKLFMKITDDGKGFDTEEISFGRGLNDIRKRAELLNASLSITSKQNNGTSVELVLNS